jgi:hypothetical protein
MLKSNNYKKNDIVTIKLISGEELLGKFVEESKDEFTVKSPSVLGADAKGGMGLFPWIISAKNDTVPIKHSTIATTAETSKEIADNFTKATSEIQIVTP